MKKEDSEVQVIEEAGIAFNPETQHLDLSKEEKRRTTALLMAIQAYDKLIIKEAEYLRQATDNARREEGPKIQPATIEAMIDAAWKFDCFISGKFQEAVEEGEVATAATTQTPASQK